MANKPSVILPVTSAPAVSGAVRKLLAGAQASAGTTLGQRFSVVEKNYPTARDPVCLVFQYDGKTIAYMKPDGSITGVT